jgi:hypothetical protein
MLRNPLQRRNKHLIIFEVYGGLAFVTASDFFVAYCSSFSLFRFSHLFFSLFSCVLLCGDVGLTERCVRVCEIAFSRVVGEFMQVYEIQLLTFVPVICSITNFPINKVLL